MCKFVKSETLSCKIERLPWGVSDVTILHRYIYVFKDDLIIHVWLYFSSDNDWLDINIIIGSTQQGRLNSIQHS